MNQTPLFDDPVMLIHRANQIATGALESALKRAGIELTSRQYVVMAALEAAAGTSQTSLVTLTGIDRSTLSEIMRRLARKRLAERRRSGSDKRAYAIRLTREGRTLLDRALPIVSLVNAEFVALVPEASRASFMATLKQVATWTGPAAAHA